MGKVAQIALPVLGAVFGGPLGASALGGAIGTTAGTMVGAGIGSGLGSYATGGDFLKGALMGGAGAGVGEAFNGMVNAGGTGIANAAEIAGGGGESIGATMGSGGSALPQGVLEAADPIEAIDALLRAAPEGMGATEAAQSFGYGSAESLLGAANPAFVNTSPFMQGASNMLNNMGLSGAAKATGGGLGGIADSTGLTSLAKSIGIGAGGSGPGVRQGLGLLSGVSSIYSGLEAQKQAKRLQEMAQASMSTDAMDPYRAGYASQLQSLVNDPSSLEKTPGYQAGLQALQRSLAAQGFTGSGNAQAALTKYGGDAYAQQVELLRRLASGGGTGNGTAIQGYSAGANLGGQGLASIGYGIRGLGY